MDVGAGCNFLMLVDCTELTVLQVFVQRVTYKVLWQS